MKAIGNSIALLSNNAFSIYNFRGELIRDLVGNGVRVYALAPDYDEELLARITELGAIPIKYHLNRTSLSVIGDFRSFISLVRELRNLRVDAVLTYFMKPVIYGSAAALLARIPRRYALIAGLGFVFTDSAQINSAKHRFLKMLVSRMYRGALALCDTVFFQNDQDVEYFVHQNIVKPKRVLKLNGTGVNLEKYKPSVPPKQPVTFLLMARLLKQKGIAEYVAAAKIVKASHPEARFILLGDTDPNPNSLTTAQIEQWVEQGIITWPGRVSDVAPFIEQASVYVLPSYYREGVPRSTQEAMAMGRPVITTNNVGCRDTVVDGVSGYCVPVRDVTSLAAAMTKFLKEPDLISTMGLESRKLAEERFDVRQINKQILEAMGVRKQRV